jgi:hypothetical protein
MKVSYNWLKDYVPLDDNLDEIAEKLTLAGIEIESIDPTNTPSRKRGGRPGGEKRAAPEC